jgi:hypothetical protein
MPRLVCIMDGLWLSVCCMCAAPAFFHFFSLRKLSSRAPQVIIMALASTNNTPFPRGKDLVLLCMDYRYYEYDNATNTTRFKLGEKMIWVGCPNSKSEAIYKYSLDFSVKCGFTNPGNHLDSCVGSNDNMVKFVQARQNAKLLEKEQDERSKAMSKQPLLQQTLPTYNFFPSKAILSILFTCGLPKL